MAVLIGALLAILVVVVLLYPFVKTRSRSHTPSKSGDPDYNPTQSPLSSREMVYEDIRTLQLEHELGSIDDQEYQEHLRAYRMQAATTLRDQEHLEIDRSLEEEILAVRDQIGNASVPSSCQSCGSALALEDDSCAHCGANAVRYGPEHQEGEGGRE